MEKGVLKPSAYFVSCYWVDVILPYLGKISFDLKTRLWWTTESDFANRK